MNTTIIPFLIMFISVNIYSAELNPNNYVHIHYCYFDNKRYAFAISLDEAKSMKVWNLNEREQTPVLPQEAERLARKHIDSIKIPENYGWKLDSISLEPINPFRLDKFIYTVQYSYYVNGPMTGVWPYMKYIITMDGKLIDPIVDDYKM